MLWLLLLLSCENTDLREGRSPSNAQKLSDQEEVLYASDSALMDYFGSGISCGDVDGDGYGDLLVAGRTSEQIYIYSGSVSGIDSSTETIFTGTTATYGSQVRSGGDLNGDGYDDVVLGDPVTDATGSVYVHYGSATGVVSSTVQTISASDGSVGDYFGAYASLTGDLNGDGYDDLAVGANLADPTGTDSGAVYIYYGSSTGLDSSTEEKIVPSDSAAGQHFGRDVTLLPDIDGDGFGEVAMGAPRDNTYTGAVYIYKGVTSGVDSTSELKLTPSAISKFGHTLDYGHDIDGDGFGDLLVGAPWTASGTSSSGTGMLYVYYGTSSGIGSTHDTLSDVSHASDYASAVAGLGDIDGDGYADVMVQSLSRYSAGNSTVYYGSSTGLDESTEFDLNHSGLRGGTETCAGDWDNDGISDFASSDSTEGEWGKTFYYSGRVRLYPGQHRTWYPDLDGDGFGDSTAGITQATPPSGYISDDTDCDDTDAAVNPDGTEVVGDGTDGDCDGREDCRTDRDGDGYTDALETVSSKDMDCDDSGEADNSVPTGDCDDGDAYVNPLGTEHTGDEVDQDCDGQEICYADGDGDGYGDGSTTVLSTDTDCSDSGEAITTSDPDCDDGDATIYPGAEEVVADGIDQDCDGVESCFFDVDADGDVATSTTPSTDTDCSDAGEYATAGGDCDDTDASIASTATEVPGDGVDQDCDKREQCYHDLDRDDVRSNALRLSDINDWSCIGGGEAPAVMTSGDCDDTDATIYPGATELPGDSVDQDCDGSELCYTDGDGDGERGTGTASSGDSDCLDFGEFLESDTLDCDDTDASIHTGGTELPGDGLDQDCDGLETCYEDLDGDSTRTSSTGVGTTLNCSATGEAPSSMTSGDCDDTRADVYPGASEVIGDEVDQDCDGLETCYEDADGDGDRSTTTVSSSDMDCTDSGEAVSSAKEDCDDTDAAINSSATEIPGDEVDQDCDGQEICYTDVDADSYGVSTLRDSVDTDCSDSNEATTDGADCDDTNASIYPGATEVVADGVDQDCDGVDTCYADADGDGYTTGTVKGTDLSCAGLGESNTLTATDCEDADATINPGATELTGDGVDQNCDGLESCYRDSDGDGARGTDTISDTELSCSGAGRASATATADCNDADGDIFPGATEGLGDGTDQDCDGLELCWQDLDQDGAHAALTAPSATLDCSDGSTAPASAVSGDCDDGDPARSPLLAEVPGDEVDQDCDLEELCYSDQDADGYRTDETQSSADWTCTGAGLALATVSSGDCDDADPRFHPGAEESDCSDPLDYNCDGSVAYEDADLDGHAACEDCRDDDPWVNPDASEVCDGFDNDCDGTIDNDDALNAPLWFEDQDQDGFGLGNVSARACEAPERTSALAGDCEDGDKAIYPGAPDSCGDGVDQDCDGRGGPSSDEDRDGLTWLQEQELGTDACQADSDGDGLLDGEDRRPSCSGCGGGTAPSSGALMGLLLIGFALRSRRMGQPAA
ncbi:MAG: hypothetical protein ACI9VR_001480 [Cognaticolwellia sp.]|jgi:hypothetical protein